jgi:hypothetical protein
LARGITIQTLVREEDVSGHGETHTIADALAFLSGHKAVIWEERGAIVHFVDAISGLDLLVWVENARRGFRKKQLLSVSVVGWTVAPSALSDLAPLPECRSWHLLFELRFGLSLLRLGHVHALVRTFRQGASRDVCARIVHADASVAYFGQIRAV